MNKEIKVLIQTITSEWCKLYAQDVSDRKTKDLAETIYIAINNYLNYDKRG